MYAWMRNEQGLIIMTSRWNEAFFHLQQKPALAQGISLVISSQVWANGTHDEQTNEAWISYLNSIIKYISTGSFFSTKSSENIFYESTVIITVKIHLLLKQILTAGPLLFVHQVDLTIHSCILCHMQCSPTRPFEQVQLFERPEMVSALVCWWKPETHPESLTFPEKSKTKRNQTNVTNTPSLTSK